MALTKPTFYLTLIMVGILFFFGLVSVGDSLINNDRTDIDEKSVDYLSAVKGQNFDSGFDNIADKEVSSVQDNKILGENGSDSPVSTDNDFLSTLFIKKERANEPTNYFVLVYNIPTSILIGFGLPVAPFKHYVNIVVFTLFIGIMLTIWNKVINP